MGVISYLRYQYSWDFFAEYTEQNSSVINRVLAFQPYFSSCDRDLGS